MMHQGQAQAAVKAGTKPGMSNPVDPNSTDEQRMFMSRQPLVFDGKRMRKPVARKTIDYNSSVVRYLENRKWFKSLSSRHTIQPDESYATEVLPPFCMMDNATNAVTTKFVRTSTNKLRCPIFCVVWTPEGRRLVTGASSGEFTLWNGLTFNFETILTAHDLPVRSMVWSHNDSWLLSGDHGGVVKYWQSNMNNVQMYEAHKEPIRGLSFSPTDNKYASCADDGLVKIWDFYRCTEEKVLRGHGADVKCIDWHPTKSILVSGSKDSQQPIKLWDTRTGNGLATLHLHKSTVMSIKWNQNGNWLLTASRDHLLKLFDIRMMKEIQSFRGHKREATAIAWHPIHEALFASGGSDGSIMFWNAGVEKDVGNMESAHDGMVWSLAWHPLGHILCSGSNDHSSKFWTRNRLGDRMRDKYNLNMQDTEDDMGDDIIGAPGFSINHTMAIPGMESTAADPDSLEYDGLDYATLPGFRGPPRPTEPEFNSSRPGIPERPVIPGFGSPPSKSTQQLPPFANPGEEPRMKFGPPDTGGPGAPFRQRGDGDFDMQQRNESADEQERHWKPHHQPNKKFPQGPPQEQRQRPDDQGPPNEAREHRGPDGWGPPRDPRELESRGGRGNEPRFGPGPNFPRGPHGPGPRDSFKRGPQNNLLNQGILGSPPRGPEGLRPESELWPHGASPLAGGRMGLLGSPPTFAGPSNAARLGILGPQPGGEQDREPEPRRAAGEREEHRDPLSPNFDVHGIQPAHPHDLSSRGFRRGMGRAMVGPRKGIDTNLQRPHPQDLKEERNGENRGRGHPFQRAGRGGPREPQGPDDNRRPWPPNSGPIDPRFRGRPEEHDQPDRRPFERQQPWDEPPDSDSMHSHEFRGPPHMEPNHGPRDFGPPPRDPRGPHFGRGPPQDIDTRDPRGPPSDPSERRPSDDSQRPPEGKPRPLMSLMSLSPIIPAPGRQIELEDPDRPPNQRKRSGEGELDRERDREWDNNIGPPQKMRFPPGPPDDRRDSRGERPFPEEKIAWRGRGGMR